MIWKHQKIINLKQKNKIKISNFYKKNFKKQKQTNIKH
jgi:hypothetical protein